MNSGIYRIDLGNGWFYIGSAVNFRKRERQHLSDLKRKKHHNIRVQSCWNKYEIFKFTILEKCEISELLLLEQKYIDKHFFNIKNVNISPTAGSNLGITPSATTREKLSAAGKGRVVSAETRAKMSISAKARLSPEERAKMSARQIGRVHSEETRKKISESLKGTVVSDETRKKLSICKKGKVLSAEHRAKISAAKKGRAHSLEHRKKIIATKKLRREQMGK
jgi:group I intron endonuclease